MAVTIQTPPRSPALSRDHNFVGLRTSLPIASARPAFLVSGIAADGNPLRLRWGNTLVEMTFVAAITGAGKELLAANGQTQEEFYAQLVEGLYSIPEINAAFTITLRSDGVLLTLRGAVTGDLLAASDGVTVQVFGSGANANPNLSAALILYRTDQVEEVVRLKGHYELSGDAEINLKDLIALETGLPPVDTLGGGPAYAASQPAGFAEYYFRYADRYGNPPVTEILTKSPTYAMVAGGSGGATRYRWGRVDPQICHAYLNARSAFFSKPIGPDQPDWCYVYFDATRSVSVSITAYFDDGTNASRTVAAAASYDRGLHCFPSGPVAVGLNQVPGADTKEVLRYEFNLVGTSVKITYDLVPECLPWAVYLAYDNGVGGIESVLMRGKTEQGYGASSETFRRARTRVQRADVGEVSRYNVEGGDTFRLRSGYYSADYIRHLRQLTMGRVWLIDVSRSQFIEMQVTSSSLDLTKDDDDLHSLEINLQPATPDMAAHYL